MIELREDPGRTHLATSENRVVALYESTNQPHVQPTGRSAQTAQATVAALQNDEGDCEIVVSLHLTEGGENVVYASEPIPAASVPQALEEAVLFAESMGFILDPMGWAGLDLAHRRAVLDASPAFQPPRARTAAPPKERQRPGDAMEALARLFAAFSLALAAGCATGMSAEQKARDAEIHYELGTNLMNTGDAQGALKEYLAGLASNAEMPQLYNGLGLLYAFSLSRPAEAEEHFKKAIELAPAFSEANNNYGAFLLSRGRFAEAVPRFEKALANPVYAERVVAEGNLAWALYKTGQADKGIARLKSALLVAPRYCKGWRSLGTIYSELNKLDEAADAFARYAGACPDAADAHLQKGKILVRLTRADEARGEFEKCAKANPEKEAAIVAECARFLRELGAP